MRYPAKRALDWLWRRRSNAGMPKLAFRHIEKPTPHKAVVWQSDVEGAIEDDGPKIRDEGCPNSHGNDIQDLNEFGVQRAHGVSICSIFQIGDPSSH